MIGPIVGILGGAVGLGGAYYLWSQKNSVEKDAILADLKRAQEQQAQTIAQQNALIAANQKALQVAQTNATKSEAAVANSSSGMLAALLANAKNQVQNVVPLSGGPNGNYRGATADPYALALVSQSGAIINATTNLAKSVPDIVNGIGGLFGNGTSNDRYADFDEDFGYDPFFGFDS